jgi:diketogulonate reductase-like aldo/keto reductase
MAHVAAFNRRSLIGGVAATAAAALLRPALATAPSDPIITKPIPSTGEALPVVGLGSWITFNVGDDEAARASCAEVMASFFEAGGRMIDSSPMYGSSQAVIGSGLQRLGKPPALFSADKVWTPFSSRGPAQIEASRRHWNVASFDLLQVHNLLAWQEHLQTLLAMKAAGQLRYVGITTSEGRRHREVEQIMRAQPLDFVQVTYNVLDREVEGRILPLARERGIAVIINRPTSSAIGFPPGLRRSIAAIGRSSSSSSSSRIRPSPARSRQRPASRMSARTWAPPAAACRTRPRAAA